MRNLYIAIEEDQTRFSAGKTVYTFAVHQGDRREAKRFEVMRNTDTGEIKMDEKIPPFLQRLLRNAVLDHIAAVHLD